jgi:3-keto-5-aminohexanoate cleavage enzyme
MSAHDAHYSGELVDGARLLSLFGDLATELLIVLDGDEGVFRAYESVEFVAPVFVGDFIEATAELVRIGATSREMRFEAKKVMTNLRRPGVASSAADVLLEPLVVCRATGTCVTPQELQRRPKELYMPALPPGPPPHPEAVITPVESDPAGPSERPLGGHEPDGNA